MPLTLKKRKLLPEFRVKQLFKEDQQIKTMACLGMLPALEIPPGGKTVEYILELYLPIFLNLLLVILIGQT